MSFVVRLAKENMKFSGSHFTIFGPADAERLHGHNYYVSVLFKVQELQPQLGLAFDFNLMKPLVRKICEELDERVLVPEKSSFLKVNRRNAQVEVQFARKFYSLPSEDVVLLPIANVTSEELARWIATRLASDLPKSAGVKHLQVSVEETRGQSVSYTLKMSSKQGT